MLIVPLVAIIGSPCLISGRDCGIAAVTCFIGGLSYHLRAAAEDREPAHEPSPQLTSYAPRPPPLYESARRALSSLPPHQQASRLLPTARRHGDPKAAERHRNTTRLLKDRPEDK